MLQVPPLRPRGAGWAAGGPARDELVPAHVIHALVSTPVWPIQPSQPYILKTLGAANAQGLALWSAPSTASSVTSASSMYSMSSVSRPSTSSARAPSRTKGLHHPNDVLIEASAALAQQLISHGSHTLCKGHGRCSLLVQPLVPDPFLYNGRKINVRSLHLVLPGRPSCERTRLYHDYGQWMLGAKKVDKEGGGSEGAQIVNTAGRTDADEDSFIAPPKVRQCLALTLTLILALTLTLP